MRFLASWIMKNFPTDPVIAYPRFLALLSAKHGQPASFPIQSAPQAFFYPTQKLHSERSPIAFPRTHKYCIRRRPAARTGQKGGKVSLT